MQEPTHEHDHEHEHTHLTAPIPPYTPPVLEEQFPAALNLNSFVYKDLMHVFNLIFTLFSAILLLYTDYKKS